MRITFFNGYFYGETDDKTSLFWKYHMSRGKNPRTSVKLHHTGLQDFTDVHHNMTSLEIMIDIQ